MAPAIFLTLFAVAVTLALALGGMSGRAVALVLLLALLGSFAVKAAPYDNFRTPLWSLFLIDALTAAALAWFARWTRRDWVTAIAAMQLLSALSHPARAFGVDPMNWVYYGLSVIWSYGIVLTLLWATLWNRPRRGRQSAAPRLVTFSLRSFLRRLLRWRAP